MYGAGPMYRTLKAGDKGRDVEQLERNLAALGYTGFTPDTEYTELTAAAVKRWQKAHGSKQTGTVGPQDIAFAPGKVRIKGVAAAVGDLAQPGAPVLTTTGSERIVTFALDVAESRLAKAGTKVDVDLPDGTSAPGHGLLGRPDGEARQGPAGRPAPRSTLTVSFDEPDEVGGFDQSPVTVNLTGETRKDVLTVPVNALLALPGGGFGVRGRTERHGPRGEGGARHVRGGPGRGIGRRAERGHEGRGAEDMSGAEDTGGGTNAVEDGDEATVVGLRGVTKEYAGGVAALRGVDLTVARGRTPRHRRPVRLRQVHAAAHRRHPGPPHRRDRPHRRPRRGGPLRPPPLRPARPPRRASSSRRSTWSRASRARDNVAEGLLYSGLPRCRRRRRAAEALDRVGLADRLDHKPHQLSGGAEAAGRHRPGGGRANPALLLADEPTGALDSASGAAVMELLRDLNREGATIAVITHDTEIAGSLPREVRIRDGEMVADIRNPTSVPSVPLVPSMAAGAEL